MSRWFTVVGLMLLTTPSFAVQYYSCLDFADVCPPSFTQREFGKWAETLFAPINMNRGAKNETWNKVFDAGQGVLMGFMARSAAEGDLLYGIRQKQTVFEVIKGAEPLNPQLKESVMQNLRPFLQNIDPDHQRIYVALISPERRRETKVEAVPLQTHSVNRNGTVNQNVVWGTREVVHIDQLVNDESVKVSPANVAHVITDMQRPFPEKPVEYTHPRTMELRGLNPSQVEDLFTALGNTDSKAQLEKVVISEVRLSGVRIAAVSLISMYFTGDIINDVIQGFDKRPLRNYWFK
jgi:hypothetical protein